MSSKETQSGASANKAFEKNSKPSWLRREKNSKYVSLGILVLVIVVVAGLLWWHNENNNAAKNKAEAQKQAAQTAVDHANQLDQSGDYASEAKVYKNYLATNPPKKYQYKPLVSLGLLAQMRKDYKSALNYYNQAIAINGGNLSEFDAENIALVAGATGDKPKMLVYFKKALQIAEANPKAYTDIKDLKATIKNLEATK